MLPASNRLSHKQDFQKTFERGRKAYAQGFHVRVLARKNSGLPSRFGFVVGLKLSKSAVVRNQVRRRMREVVRLRHTELKPGFDVVLLALPEARGFSSKKIEEEIVKLLKKIGLLL